jgi:hypothetical protein
MTFWKSVTGSLTNLTSNIIPTDTPKKKQRSFEEPDDPDLKQIYTGCHLLITEYLQEGDKSKHFQFWQTLRDSVTNLGASADFEGLKSVLNSNSIIALIETIRTTTAENTADIAKIVQILEIFQKKGLNCLNDLAIKVFFNQIHGKENHHKLLMRSITEKKRKEEELLAKKDMDSVVMLRDDLKGFHESVIKVLDGMIEMLLHLKLSARKCIQSIESEILAMQLPFEKENTFSMQFSEKVIDLYLEPLRLNIKNAVLDRSEFEIRQSNFFVEEGEKSRLQKEEFRRIEGLEEDLRHDNEIQSLKSFLQHLIDKENEMHEYHCSGGSTDRILEDLAIQNNVISGYVKQRQQDLQKTKEGRSEVLREREEAEKTKKERLDAVGIKVKERLEWLEFSQKQFEAVVRERETFIKCLALISNAIDRLAVGLNELIDKEMKTVIDNQVERINDYLNFLDQRIQAKNKDIKFLSEKIVKKKQKHTDALERDDQTDARKLKDTIEQYAAKLLQSENVLKESMTRTQELQDRLNELTSISAPIL